jgi:hypothetical protein
MALSVTTAHLFNGPDNVSSPFDLFTLGPERRVSQHMSELKYAAAHSRSFFSFFFLRKCRSFFSAASFFFYTNIIYAQTSNVVSDMYVLLD